MNRAFVLFLILFVAAVIPAAAISVTDHGAAGDGRTDDSSAFQTALDLASGTGAVVHVPAGTYRIDRPLQVPRGVQLAGVREGLTTSHLDKGSVLHLYWGKNDEDGEPAISLAEGAAIRGLTLYYPEQLPLEFTPYSWTIQAQGREKFATNPLGSGQHALVQDVVIANAWQGIDLGTYHNEGHSLRNVQMCALKTGVYIDNCSDVGRIENVHVHSVYWWRVAYPDVLDRAVQDELNERTQDTLTGFKIGRCDWLYMDGCFVIWAKTGFHIVNGNPKPGYKQGQPNFVITNSGSDVGPQAVLVDYSQRHAGLAFSNCQFMGGFEISPTNYGPIKISNSGFWGVTRTGSQVILEGTGTLTLVSTHFNQRGVEGEEIPIVHAKSGNLIMSACEFLPNGDEKMQHVLLEEGVRAAIITGNLFHTDEPRIENASAGEVVIEGNVAVAAED